MINFSFGDSQIYYRFTSYHYQQNNTINIKTLGWEQLLNWKQLLKQLLNSTITQLKMLLSL